MVRRGGRVAKTGETIGGKWQCGLLIRFAEKPSEAHGSNTVLRGRGEDRAR